MKKFVALLMAAVMLMCAASALAATEITWSSVVDQVKVDDGAFYPIEAVNAKIWIPNEVLPVELGEEDIEAGYALYFEAENGFAVAVMYVDVEGADLEAYADYLASESVNVESAVVNGLPCLTYSYENEEGNVVNVVSFATELGYILEVSFSGGTPEFDLAAQIIAASIQPAE